VGRVRSYRQRVELEMRSVWMKSVVVLMERALREEFARGLTLLCGHLMMGLVPEGACSHVYEVQRRVQA
jgi:hypothetical protein